MCYALAIMWNLLYDSDRLSKLYSLSQDVSGKDILLIVSLESLGRLTEPGQQLRDPSGTGKMGVCFTLPHGAAPHGKGAAANGKADGPAEQSAPRSEGLKTNQCFGVPPDGRWNAR